jgi:RHS repeat-associated protein
LYETTSSRLKQVTDAKLQVAQYLYFLDNNLKQITYTNAPVPTPAVSFTYDPAFNRVATVQDGMGTTTYGYGAITSPPSLGSGRLASIDGPLANDVVTYAYDELGRISSRAVNAVTSTQTYDAFGRIATEANSLGTFTYGYVGATQRLLSTAYPNGQTSSYLYYGNTGDHRLQEIHHKRADGSTLSRLGLAYNVGGSLTAWTQQTDSNPAREFQLGYNAAEELINGVLKTTGPSPVVLKRYANMYDAVGNRTTEQVDDATTSATYNSTNEMTLREPGGDLRIGGTTNEPATVTIQGKPVHPSSDNEFVGVAAIGAGTNSVAVTALDSSGNLRANTYQVSASGTSTTYTYDSNGNLVADGARTFEWDAEDRLVAVSKGTKRTEFTYDGFGRRARVLEMDSGVTTGDSRFVWCGAEICEQRDGGTNAVTRRFFSAGEEQGGTAYFYTRDHLGSVRELTDSSGVIRARYEYDLYGRATKLSGDRDSSLGFAGGYLGPSAAAAPDQGLQYHVARYYDGSLGRFLSRDPAGLEGGINLYTYALGNPSNWVDPYGLGAWVPKPKPSPTPKPCDWFEPGCRVALPTPPPPPPMGGTPSCFVNPGHTGDCPYTPKPCVEFFDVQAYWACLAIRLTSGDIYQGPSWTGPCSAATAAMQCAKDATYCFGGEAPNAPSPNGPSPDGPPMVPHRANPEPPVRKGHFH